MLTHATGEAVYTGQANTTLIVSVQGVVDVYAARSCDELVRSSYSDWFMPSLNELTLLYAQKNVVGGMGTKLYWSSTEINLNNAQAVNFANGLSFGHAKNTPYYVRPIRYFDAE
jgi:hypothetical protein